jgi:hypothetical protein
MKRLGLYALLAANLTALPAQADEFESQWYGGVGLGLAKLSVNKNSVPYLSAASSVNSNSYNLNVFAGYQFDPFLGIELDYLGGGSVTATSLGQTSKLFSVGLTTISATMGAPLNDNVRLYAKLGGTSWKFSSQRSVDMNDGFGPSAGLGADINLYGSAERRLRIEYNYYQLDKVYVKSASSLTISAIFNFPEKAKMSTAKSGFKDGESKWLK